MKKVFTFLRGKNLVRRNKPNIDVLKRLARTEIHDLAQELVEISTRTDIERESTVFAHSASLSLGGGREECRELSCRLRRLESLARFVLLYSDRAYINNFFSDYHHFRNWPQDRLQATFHEDLLILLEMKSLLESGFIQLFAPSADVCPHCLSYYKNKYLPEEKRRASRLFLKLKKDYLEGSSVILERDAQGYAFYVSGPPLLYEHGGHCWTANRLPSAVKCRPRLVKRLESDGRLIVSKTLQKELHFHRSYANTVVRTVSFGTVTAQALGTSFLTDRDLDVSCLAALSTDTDIEARNRLAFAHMKTFVPFVDDVSLKNLTTVRERERESLIQFRTALNRAIDEFRNRKTRFTSKTAKELYSDLIAPRLATLDKRLSSAKKDLVSKVGRSVIATSGALVFGLYTGVLPAELLGMAKAFGLTKITSDLIREAMALRDAEKTIRNDELYFLWKLRGRKH